MQDLSRRQASDLIDSRTKGAPIISGALIVGIVRSRSQRREDIFSPEMVTTSSSATTGISKGVAKFLKDQSPDLYSEYLLERYRKPLRPKEKPLEIKARPHFAKKVSGLTPISELNSGHPAREFLEKRQIPEDKFASLFLHRSLQALGK